MAIVEMITQKEIENKLKDIIALALSHENNATIIEICFEIMERLMPLATPKPNESEDQFMNRCMTDDTMQQEYPGNTQRYAVCVAQWGKKQEKDDGN